MANRYKIISFRDKKSRLGTSGLVPRMMRSKKPWKYPIDEIISNSPDNAMCEYIEKHCVGRANYPVSWTLIVQDLSNKNEVQYNAQAVGDELRVERCVDE
jgi:hypothetical protein